MTKEERTSEILYVTGSFEVGGTERQLAAVAARLVQSGWRVAVYSVAGDGPMRHELEQAGATIILPPIGIGRTRRSLIWRAMRLIIVAVHMMCVFMARRPLIVHIFLPSAYVLAGPLAIMTLMPIRIMSRRSLNTYRKNRAVVWWLERRLHRWMTAILGNSRAVVRQLRDEESVPERKLGLIYNGIDMQRFGDNIPKSAIRAKLALETSKLVMVIVANLIPYKGYRDLIKALGIAKSQLPEDWHLLAVGEDYGISGELRSQARALGIESKVTFLGMRNDVIDILLAADVGLLCSHEEGFSNAILEGMAAGLPMVVTSVGGNAEAVVQGETGIIVPPYDPPELAKAIVRLACDAELRSKFGSAARLRVADKFSLDQAVASYDALYRTLMNGGLPNDLPQLRFSDAALSSVGGG